MPHKPLRPCSVPGCPEVAVKAGRCARHAQLQERRPDERPSAAARGYDRKWRRIRRQFLARHPICADCGAEASQAHHIVPVAQGGTNRWENLMPLCEGCHARRTRRG